MILLAAELEAIARTLRRWGKLGPDDTQRLLAHAEEARRQLDQALRDIAAGVEERVRVWEAKRDAEVGAILALSAAETWKKRFENRGVP